MQTAIGQAALQDDPHRYRIVPIGTGPVGWAIERDGKIWCTGPRLEMQGAWLGRSKKKGRRCR
jgi:hypothetical protein